MSSTMKISFKLTGEAASLARALHDQVRREVDPAISLDELVSRQFVRWMRQNLIQPETIEAEVSDGCSQTTQTEAGTGTDQPSSEATIPGDTLLQAET